MDTSAVLIGRTWQGFGWRPRLRYDTCGRATVSSVDDSTLVLQAVINDDPDNTCASRGTVHLILVTHNRATISWQDGGDASRLANGFAQRT